MKHSVLYCLCCAAILAGCTSSPPDSARDTVLATSLASSTAAPATTSPPMVRVFTESPLITTDLLTDTFLTQPAYFHGEAFHPSMDAQTVAAVSYLKTQPPGYRGACFGGWFFTPLTQSTYPSDVSGLPAATPLKDFQQGYISNLSWETARLAKVAQGLANANITLDFVYFDYESSYNIWGAVDPATLATIVADPQARSHFPADVLAATPGGVIPPFSSPLCRSWVLAMNKYCVAMTRAAMRKVLRDSGLQARSTLIINFAFCRPGSFLVYDVNGWPLTFNATIDNAQTSCPTTYLGDGLYRYPAPVLIKDHLWNALIEDLNHTRSAAAVGPTVPVIETCDWTPDREWATEMLISHDVRMGVTTFDLFNPAGCQQNGETAKLAAIIARQYRFARATRLSLPEIPLDADSITTGDYVTKYTDFLAVVTALRSLNTPASRVAPAIPLK